MLSHGPSLLMPWMPITLGKGGLPSWLPSGAEFYADFVNGNYWNGAFTDFATTTDFTRNSVGWADNLTGAWSQFAIDAARITNKGLLIEPASTNLVTAFAAPEFNSFTDISVGDGTTTGPLGGLGKTLSNILSSSSAAGVSAVGTITASETWCGSIWLRGSGTVRIRIARVGGGTFEQTVGDDIALSSTFTRHELAHTYANNQTGGRLDIMGGSSGTASSCEAYGGQFELGSEASSPIVTTGASATRAVDALTLHLGSETLDLTFTFDDDSTQTATGQTGDYAVPTNLDRAVVKSVAGFPG